MTQQRKTKRDHCRAHLERNVFQEETLCRPSKMPQCDMQNWPGSACVIYPCTPRQPARCYGRVQMQPMLLVARQWIFILPWQFSWPESFLERADLPYFILTGRGVFFLFWREQSPENAFSSPKSRRVVRIVANAQARASVTCAFMLVILFFMVAN